MGNHRMRTKLSPGTFAVVFVTVAVLVLGALLWLGREAYGAGSICRPVQDPDQVCSPHQMAREFRHGRFKRAHGFKPAHLFAHPRVARRIIATKVTRRLGHTSAAKKAAIRRHLGITKDDPGCTDRCLAYRMYDDMVTDASCVTRGIPTNRTHTCYKLPDSAITKRGIQNGIMFTLCVGGLAAAIVTKTTNLWTAMFGGAACGWGLYMGASPPQ